MTKDEQEKFEDYLVLERCIEMLQTSKQVHIPEELSAQQIQVYRAMLLLHSATLNHQEPRPEFVEQLASLLTKRAQEKQEQLQPDDAQGLPDISQSIEAQSPQSVTTVEHEVHEDQNPEAARRLKRRRVLMGSAAVAASFLAGTVVEHVVTPPAPSTNTNPPPYNPSSQLNIDTRTIWHFVTTSEQIGDDAFRFATDALVGYIMHDDENRIIAFSASCTHMGCLVHWHGGTQREFVCPCHGGCYDEYGNPTSATKNKQLYLTSLPRLETKVESGNVYVKIPSPQQDG